LLAVAVAGELSLSVAVKETVNVPAAVGVPVIRPAVLILNPAGRTPLLRAKVTGAVPPVDVTDEEKVVPTWPLMVELEDGDEIAKGAAAMTKCMSGLTDPSQNIP
jgi:hypothetical protein